MPTSRPLGLVLGGGAALGAAHVGVLRALDAHGIRPDVVAGTSAGALIGAAVAVGMPTPVIERQVRAATWSTFGKFTLSLRLGLLDTTALEATIAMLGEDPDRLARDLQDMFPKARLIGGDAAFEDLVARVVGFVEAPGLGLDLPLDVRDTAFQQRVWQALRAIPCGQTASYAEIARRIGEPKSVRAVAQACAANRLAVAIPCHRVVRTDGALSGYRWGVERKRSLIETEARR